MKLRDTVTFFQDEAKLLKYEINGSCFPWARFLFWKVNLRLTLEDISISDQSFVCFGRSATNLL